MTYRGAILEKAMVCRANGGHHAEENREEPPAAQIEAQEEGEGRPNGKSAETSHWEAPPADEEAGHNDNVVSLWIFVLL